MQTAGLVLDIYDNPSDLKTIFPSLDVVPEAVKVAHQLTSAERDELPDDVFALVLMEDGDRLRKYACVDEGNTLLNIASFFRHGDKLPAEVQKVAAENLKVACGWYGIEVPEELEKVALGLGTVATALTAPAMIKGTGSQIKGNLAAARDAGGVVITPREQAIAGSMLKNAELNGSLVMPNQGPSTDELANAGTRGKPGSTDTSAMKNAAALEPDVAGGTSGSQYKKAPQTPVQTLRPHVSTLGVSHPTKVREKVAEHTAYAGVFPLDSYTQVQAASRYFDENVRGMGPEMRHTFAVNMVKRASAMGIAYSDTAANYGSTTYASDAQIKVAFDARRPHLTEKLAEALDTLYASRALMAPSEFCELLSELDKAASIEWRYDSAIPDPFASTYGLQKSAADEGNSWIDGNDYITKKQIENYAVTAARTLLEDYGEDFMKEFQKDPWGIFSSLPVDQKRRLARAAGDNGATGMYDVD